MTTTQKSDIEHVEQHPERLGTVIIGAGQTGLATAYFLGRAGVPCVVLDEHARVGDQWRQRYDSLLLNTPARYDGLPGMPFPAPGGSYPSGAAMGDPLSATPPGLGSTCRAGAPFRPFA